MNVIAPAEFQEDLETIKDKSVLKRVDQVIDKFLSAKSLREVTNVKYMQGYPGYYRIRLGDFRIGFRLIDGDTIKLLTIDHRSKIYKHFPDNYA